MNIDEIATWKDWCRSFQNIEMFKEIVCEIFDRHNLTFAQIENTYPGTNAVFKVGQYIVKIFVPEGVKHWDEDDYAIELEHARHHNETSCYVPGLIAYGTIKNGLLWKYLVFEYVKGEHMYEVVGGMTYEEKERVVKQLKCFLSDFNVKPKNPFDNAYIIKRIIKGKRWDFLNDALKEELFHYIRSLNIKDSVRVHGDLTGDNVLFNKDGIVIIDFGDSCIAPYYYEYAPIMIDLFKLDRELVELFCDGEIDGLVELVIQSIMIHDFGGDIASSLLQDDQISGFANLHNALRKEIISRIHSTKKNDT